MRRLTDDRLPKNPVKVFRERVRMKQTEIAAAIGTSFESWKSIEYGRATSIPESILSALSELGADATSLNTQYVSWRQQRDALARETMRARINDLNNSGTDLQNALK